MSRRNKQHVPPLGQQPHILGQQQAQQPTPAQQQQQANQAMAGLLAQMSAGIYTRAAADSLAYPEGPWPLADFHRDLAVRSHKAAKMYFEGLNLAKFTDGPTPEDTNGAP